MPRIRYTGPTLLHFLFGQRTILPIYSGFLLDIGTVEMCNINTTKQNIIKHIYSWRDTCYIKMSLLLFFSWTVVYKLSKSKKHHKFYWLLISNASSHLTLNIISIDTATKQRPLSNTVLFVFVVVTCSVTNDAMILQYNKAVLLYYV